jgi:hypothetical protein
VKTFYNVIKEVQELCEAHPQIATFYYGDNIQVDQKTEPLPIAVVTPQASDSGTGFVDFNFQLTILDAPSENRSDDLEVDSKIIDLLQDVIGQFKNGNLFKTYSDYTINQDITLTPITPSPDFNDRLLGWSADVTVTVQYRKTGCENGIIYTGTLTNGIGVWKIGTTFIVS